MNNLTMTPMYSTMKFTDVWESYNDFKEDFDASPFAQTFSKSGSASLMYYLLYANYGNSPIANRDINQFKFKIFSIAFQFGPTWEKRLDIQASLRALTEEDILKGGKAIYNTAFNPGTTPSTASLDELTYINSQNTTNYKKSKMEAYAQLWELLDTDVTTEFIRKFSVCFKKFVRPENPLLYISEPIDEEEGED